MSNWMTSGRSRLQAKQGRSFAQRAQKRANFVAPDSMMINAYAPISSGRDDSRAREKLEGEIMLHNTLKVQRKIADPLCISLTSPKVLMFPAMEGHFVIYPVSNLAVLTFL